MKRLLLVIAAPLVMSSCATLFSGSTTPAVLIDAPSDLVVTEDGVRLPIEKVQAHVKGNIDQSTTTYYTSGVMLNKKVKKHTLTLSSGGKSQTIVVTLRAGINWIILDTFIGGPIAYAIDGITKKWRIAGNKFIDAPAVVNNTKHRRQGQLKRALKRSARWEVTLITAFLDSVNSVSEKIKVWVGVFSWIEARHSPYNKTRNCSQQKTRFTIESGFTLLSLLLKLCFYFHHFVTFDDVADFDVVEIVDVQTTFVAGVDLFNVVFETF